MRFLKTQAARLRDKAGRYRARVLRKIRQPNFVFVVSHMRSGSTLLTHILNTNPAIVGYGENHLAYGSDKDLDRVLAKVMQRMTRKDIRERYVVDKILHNHLKIAPHFLVDGRCWFIYLVREPRATVASILRMTNHVSTFHWNTFARASSYYISRLHQISYMAMQSTSSDRTLFISHEQLIHSSQPTFAAIQSLLGLSSPLREEYDILPTTGRPCIGDPSERIKAARILRDNQTKDAASRIPREIMHECELTYRATCNVLTTHCRPVELGQDFLRETTNAA